MADTTHTDLELAQHSFAVSGTRVRVRPDIDAAQADRLMRRGLVELHDDYDAFESGEAQKCLSVTQYGFDLILGRVPG